SERLQIDIYQSKWYNKSVQFKTMIQFMIQRTNHLILLDVGGFTTMSIVTFLTAILIFFQSLISVWKLWMFTFSQDIIYDMIISVENSDLLKNLEILQLELIDDDNIVRDISKILKDSWIDIKRQLMLLRATVFGICSWYSGQCLISNIYYLYINDDNSEDKLQFPSITCSGLFSVISVHCLTLLRVLRTIVAYCTTERVPPHQRITYLQACIRLHQNILSFCSRLNILYRRPSIALFMTCCLVICLLTFKASVDLGNNISDSIKVVLYLSAAFYELLIFCLNGQRITSESDLLPETIYNCLWYKENRNFQIMIQVMIMRTNHNIRMDVGGFARMSLVTLLTIVRSSVSYFLFLRNCM
ncbi:odorant receptor 63a-like, partial [Musca vetustissima]|uniref:odorant receptor 63a-like n=1 Tax=Musca vetustissima TaxID=27455 RepID=UPI002AB78487